MELSAAHSLSPHPAVVSPWVHSVDVGVAPVQDGLALCYRLRGDIDGLRLPSPRPSVRADHLWQHTCCEVFIAVAGHPAYLEFNFSPAGSFAAYAFSENRQRHGEADPRFNTPPKIECETSADAFQLKVVLPAAVLPEGRSFEVGLSVVVEAADGTLAYWALRHPAATPDFHHRGAFALTLEPPA